jgi:hypothetical protein
LSPKRNANAKPSKKSDSFARDLLLLKEYGFKKRTIRSPGLNFKKIDKFGMRQLDRLKLLLYRNEHLIGSYPGDLRTKISENDLRSFAIALSLLSESFAEDWEYS